MQRRKKKPSTSWGKVNKWYDDLVGTKGMYYHENIILPKLKKLIDFENQKNPALLDIGCGQGILSHHIPEQTEYHGVDISPELIRHAKKHSESKLQHFYVGDATKKLPVKKTDFTHASIILALQNMEEPVLAIENAAKHLQQGGKLILVMNHPCFRIPRQTHWGVDEKKKLQYRRLDMYMSALKIPIQASPSQGKKSETTWSFHHPLSDYFQWLSKSGFLIQHMDEWCSNKKSTGSKARMENKSRKEFPLFLCIVAIKT